MTYKLATNNLLNLYQGMLVSLNELGITVGILIAFLVNYIFTDVADGWRYMFGLSTVPAVIQGIAMIFLPKTPQFLMICKQVCWNGDPKGSAQSRGRSGRVV